MIGGDEIRGSRCKGIVKSHSEGNRSDDGDDPVNGGVGRECDREEADWDEDTADLTHDEPKFWADGTVFLDLSERKPSPTRQFLDQERVMSHTCSIMVVTTRLQSYRHQFPRNLAQRAPG